MKEIRDMDGVYFRVKRNGKYEPVCFSDLTPEEQDEILKDRDPKWLMALAKHLADCLYDAGEFVERRDRE